jgi:hypothetical protein
MSSIVISLIVFVCVFGGAVAGMLLSGPLPEHHFSADSKDTASSQGHTCDDVLPHLLALMGNIP